MILRVTLANITARELAEALQKDGTSGTVFASIGAGAWGIEHGATFETVTGPAGSDTHAALLAFVRTLLRERKEECAYLTENGQSAMLVYPDRLDRL